LSGPFYNPENFGLELTGSVDTAGAYEYDEFAVWVHKENKSIYYATDSGCSCPTPFEEVTIETMTRVPDPNALRSPMKSWGESSYGERPLTGVQISDLIKKVHDWLEANS